MNGKIVFHPFLLALFPILLLYSCNLQMMPFHELIRSVLIAMGLVSLLWVVISKVVRNGVKSGLIVSLFLVLFLTYGYVLVIASPAGSWLHWGRPLRHIGVQVLLIVLFAGASFLVVRTHRELIKVTKLVNFVSFWLVVFNLVLISIGLYTQDSGAPQSNAASQSINRRIPHRPNVYYIILDEYARGDFLQSYFHLDNKPFLDHLLQKGFYIASESHANYCNTYQSLASSLNFMYLDKLANRINPESANRLPLGKMIRDSQAVNFLKSQGYQFIAFSSGISLTEIEEADVYVKPSWALNQFEYTLLLTTPVGQLRWLFQIQNELHRQRLLYTFNHLADFAKSSTPVFVFAHILAPHPPFVFGANGERVSVTKDKTFDPSFSMYGGSDTYIPKYRAQVSFVTEEMEKEIDIILAQSQETPVIILQSDHGSGSRFDRENLVNTDIQERMSILNAYYFPGKGTQCLYPSITPVNTFRVLFNEYFGTQLRQLEDRSYYASWSRPYEFIDVSERLESPGYLEGTLVRAEKHSLSHKTSGKVRSPIKAF